MAVYGRGGEHVGATARARLVSRTAEVTDRSVRSFLAGRAAPRTVWVAPDGATVAGAGAAAIIEATSGDRFETVRKAATDVFDDYDADAAGAAGPRFLGGLSFHPDHDATEPWNGFPAARFVLPRIQLTRAGDRTTVTVNAYGPDADEADVDAELREVVDTLAPDDPPRPDPPGVTAVDRVPSRDGWHAGVRTALDRIAAGSLRKVVLAQSMRATLDRDVDPAAALGRLGNRDPECHRFLYAPTEAATLFGATPERLVSLRGRTVETEALAGSIERGETPADDETLARRLRESEKERHEHALVADAIRDQLRPFADTVAAGSRHVKRLASVQHLRTAIRARLSAPEHVLALVEALHPTPAVGGLPPDAAQETIGEAESFERGWYAAPFGWFDARGDGEFVVAIRSAVAAERTAQLFAGAGIVADSDPDEEWEEVQLKYRPVLDALTR